MMDDQRAMSLVAGVEDDAACQPMGDMGAMLHNLSNKILPIVVYTELAKRRCSDDYVVGQLDKIQQSAEEATALMDVIRRMPHVPV